MSENPYPNDKYRDDRPPLQSVPNASYEPPCDEHAEECLIASAMIDATGAGVAVAGQLGVKPDSFYFPVHSVVWTRLEELVKERAPVTLETLIGKLTESGEMEQAGGLPRLVQMTKMVPTTAELRHFAELVVAYWRRRRAMRLGAELREIAATITDRDEFTAASGDLGREIIVLSQRAEEVTLKETITNVAADVAARAAGTEDRSRWIFTGMKTFDARLKPLNSAREDGFTLVGGASGEGKSALMRQWAKAALDARQKVVFFNRETSTDGCIEQMAAMTSRVDLLHPDRCLRESLEAFATECVRMRDELADKYLFCFQHTNGSPLATIEDLVTRARQHVWTHGVPHLMVVDYLQLFTTTNRRVSKREEVVAHVSHLLQSLQRELGCCLLVAAQLNESGIKEMRTVRRDKNEKVIHRVPVGGDFRESQAIFHDADRVVAIYRPPVDSRDQDQTGRNILKPEQWLCQIKRRKGGEGIIKCRFEKEITCFVELPAGSATTTGQTKQQFIQEGK